MFGKQPFRHSQQFGDKFVSIIVTRIFGFWDFEYKCELVEEPIRVEIITATEGVEGKHRTQSNTGWRWCCGLDTNKWQRINAPTTAHDRKHSHSELKLPWMHCLPLSCAIASWRWNICCDSLPILFIYYYYFNKIDKIRIIANYTIYSLNIKPAVEFS